MNLNLTESYQDGNESDLWYEKYPDISFSIFVMQITSLIISIFGCFGNLFTIIIISKWDTLTSGATFMLILAIVDFTSASFVAIFIFVLPLSGFNLRDLNNISCASLTFAPTVIIYSSYYLTLLFSFDKFLAVMFPYKYRNFGTPKTSIYATAFVLTVECLLAIPNVLVFRIDSNFETCGAVNFQVISAEFWGKIYPLITSFINGFCPVLFVFLFTIGTILKLRNQGRKREKTRRNSRTISSRRDSEMTRQMIVVCIMFGTLCLIVTICMQNIYVIQPTKAYDQAVVYFIFAIVMFANCLINSANFYIYLIYGKKFRADFIGLFYKRSAEN